MRLAAIVATKDRPKEIRTVLAEFARQSRVPDQIIVVDSSAASQEELVREFPGLPLVYRYHQPPSASAQRNAGVALADPGIELVAFFDDDITLAPDALKNMLRFWETAPPDVAGAAFNILNPAPTSGGWLKRSWLVQRLGLYSSRMGQVMPSGWQTAIHTVGGNLETDWLPSSASVWRRGVLGDPVFDPFYDGYSYLEDLDFSHGIRRAGHRLVVVADAGFSHWPSPAGRSSQVRFGQVEVRNRLYFVRKYGLSRWRCLLGLAIRWSMTVGAGLLGLNTGCLGRAWGNLLWWKARRRD